jgi:hypothetical protein
VQRNPNALHAIFKNARSRLVDSSAVIVGDVVNVI